MLKNANYIPLLCNDQLLLQLFISAKIRCWGDNIAEINHDWLRRRPRSLPNKANYFIARCIFPKAIILRGFISQCHAYNSSKTGPGFIAIRACCQSVKLVMDWICECYPRGKWAPLYGEVSSIHSWQNKLNAFTSRKERNYAFLCLNEGSN